MYKVVARLLRGEYGVKSVYLNNCLIRSEFPSHKTAKAVPPPPHTTKPPPPPPPDKNYIPPPEEFFFLNSEDVSKKS